MRQVVGYAQNSDWNAIINIHHRLQPVLVQHQACDGGKQYEALNEWNQVAVDAVRATGGENATRYLAVAGYSANPGLAIDLLKLPEDSAAGRLLVSVHSYDPAEFALNARYTEWGHTADPVKKASWGDEEFIRGMCADLYECYVSKNIPVYFGEFGCVHWA